MKVNENERKRRETKESESEEVQENNSMTPSSLSFSLSLSLIIMMKREKDDQRETFLCRVYKRDPNGYIIPLDSKTFIPFPLVVLSKEGSEGRRNHKIESEERVLHHKR